MLEAFKNVAKDPSKIIYRLERKGLLDWITDRTYLKIIYRLTFKRKLELDDPKAFTEKIAWYKLHWRNMLAKKCTDKYEVRQYVSDKIGADYLNECYGCWDSFDAIDFDSLPEQFVLKTTNGSGNCVICTDKNSLDIKNARKMLDKYQKRHFSSKTKEWSYYGLPYKIMAERYISSEDGFGIKDYKMFCFYGTPRFLVVCSERCKKVKYDYFDLDWNWIPVTAGANHNPYLHRPAHLDEMIRIAKILSEDFPHVRVDMYDEGGRIYFGELTFYHFGGIVPFEPDEWDYEFGKYFDIGRIPKDI